MPVGSDDGGGSSFAGGDATASGALDASIDENHVTVTIVTLRCAGDCADVQAVATAGYGSTASSMGARRSAEASGISR